MKLLRRYWSFLDWGLQLRTLGAEGVAPTLNYKTENSYYTLSMYS